MARIPYGLYPIMNGYWPYGGFPDIDQGDDDDSTIWVRGDTTNVTVTTGDDDTNAVWEQGDMV
jgi:hypothetical protein